MIHQISLSRQLKIMNTHASVEIKKKYNLVQTALTMLYLTVVMTIKQI